ncbi:MAG: M23 family metallopeptidase [Clostridiales bacterium]|nr:M23 family metallopeptidase [Clostridiales bacterium]
MTEQNHPTEELFENKKKEGFVGNRGFYIVLVLCLVAVGAAVALLAFAPSYPADGLPPTVQTGQSDDQLMREVLDARTSAPTQDPTPLPTTAGASPRPTDPPPTMAPAPTAKAASAGSKAAPPVAGGIAWGYAVDKLIYSKTLDAWVTHEGVDIACDLGTKVKCVFAGTVDKVYEDDFLGFTVVVKHTNGRVTRYANLDRSVSVKEGDKVNAGDILGKVGNTAISECADDPHLHFAMYVDGKPVNPTAYVRLG